MSARSLPAPAPLTAEEFRARQVWAEKRGLPQWLWPDLSQPVWRDALRTIERATRDIFICGHSHRVMDGAADAISVAAYTSGMGPLLGYWSKKGVLSASRDIAEGLQRDYRHNSRRMEELIRRTVEVVDRLHDKGIPVTLIKGMHTAAVSFPTPGARPATDIDLVIEPPHRDIAGQVLRELGYSAEHQARLPAAQFWRHHLSSRTPQSLTFVHANDPWGIDLHTSANRRYAHGAPLIRLDDLIRLAGAQRWSFHSHAAVMPPAAAVLLLACHAGAGFGNLRILRMAELVLFIRKAGEDEPFDWEELLDVGMRTNTLQHAYAALRMASSLAPGIVPDAVLRQARKGVPPKALAFIEQLSPATVQCVTRCSVAERYMWTSSISGTIKQLAHDVIPAELPRSLIIPALKRRARRVLRGTLNID